MRNKRLEVADEVGWSEVCSRMRGISTSGGLVVVSTAVEDGSSFGHLVFELSFSLTCWFVVE